MTAALVDFGVVQRFGANASAAISAACATSDTTTIRGELVGLARSIDEDFGNGVHVVSCVGSARSPADGR